MRSASIVLPENVSFHDAAADALKVREGVEHVGFDGGPPSLKQQLFQEMGYQIWRALANMPSLRQ